MSIPLLLRVFINERLTAAADEIFQVFEATIAKYEEDVCNSKQEIERLKSLLQEFVSNQKTDSQSSICKEESTPEQEQSVGISQRDPEPRHIKEKEHELLASWQQEEGQAQEYKEADDLHLSHSSVWEKNEQEYITLTLQPHTENSESVEQFQELEETKGEEFMLPLMSTLSAQPQIHNETIQGVSEGERSAASFSSNQTQTELNQSCLITSGKSTDVAHLNSFAPDCHCYLCDKLFSSNQHLISHAFHMHSKDAGVLCVVCGNTLESTESLIVHLKSHKGSKCCHVCGKHCNSATAMAEHMTRHTGVKLHHCHVCGKGCSQKGDLKIHMRIHTGEKPFSCSYCCKRFTHSGHLRKHLRSHTGERPHWCEVCGRGFLQSVHLKYHLGTHTQKY
uniref:C2H2-type domain-containing protein n=1 Tax=Monopterus albus TaxID=43700 RepID=A0A3Q3IKL1_MONAL|nr:zinc finger protein 37 homolog [Monopterus albus]